MSHFSLFWKARAIERYRRKYEQEKIISLESGNVPIPKRTFSQNLRYQRFRFYRNIKRCLMKCFPNSCVNFWIYLWTDQTFPNFMLKSVIGFLSGIIITYVFFMFFVFHLSISLVHATVMSSIIGVLLTLGLAFSYRVRCLFLLLLPQLFSEVGRYTLMGYALILILTGPAKNTLHNAEVLSESMACGQEQLKHAAQQVKESSLKPFNSMKESIQLMVHSVKLVADDIRKTLLAINRMVLSIVNSMQSALNWLNSVVDVCNSKLGTPEQRCLRALEYGVQDCRAKLGGHFSRVCDVAFAARVACAAAKPLGAICVFVEYVNSAFANTIKRKLRTFTKKVHEMLFVSVHIHHAYSFNTSSSRSASQVAAGIVTEIRHRADRLLQLFSWMSCITSLFLLLIIFKAKHYQQRYLCRMRFDNRYMTRCLRELDQRRAREGRETLLPLNRRERQECVSTTSFRLVLHERRHLARSAVFLSITTLKLLVHIAADYSLYWILMTVRYYGRFEAPPRTPSDSAGVSVAGEGVVAQLSRGVASAVAAPLRARPASLCASCLPAPAASDTRRYAQIGVLIVLLWSMAILQPYGLRARHVVMDLYRPERARARAVWLYNHLMRRRASFLRLARRKLHRDFKMQPADLLTVKQWLRSALCWRWLRRLLGSDTGEAVCVLCGLREHSGDPNSALVRCKTARCRGVYCKSCFEDIAQLCTACLDPADYGDISDVSLEKGSSDESEWEMDSSDEQNSDKCILLNMESAFEADVDSSPRSRKKIRLKKKVENYIVQEVHNEENTLQERSDTQLYNWFNQGKKSKEEILELVEMKNKAVIYQVYMVHVKSFCKTEDWFGKHTARNDRDKSKEAINVDYSDNNILNSKKIYNHKPCNSHHGNLCSSSRDINEKPIKHACKYVEIEHLMLSNDVHASTPVKFYKLHPAMFLPEKIINKVETQNKSVNDDFDIYEKHRDYKLNYSQIVKPIIEEAIDLEKTERKKSSLIDYGHNENESDVVSCASKEEYLSNTDIVQKCLCKNTEELAREKRSNTSSMQNLRPEKTSERTYEINKDKDDEPRKTNKKKCKNTRIQNEKKINTKIIKNKKKIKKKVDKENARKEKIKRKAGKEIAKKENLKKNTDKKNARKKKTQNKRCILNKHKKREDFIQKNKEDKTSCENEHYDCKICNDKYLPKLFDSSQLLQKYDNDKSVSFIDDEGPSENKSDYYNYCHCHDNETYCGPDENFDFEIVESNKKERKFERMLLSDYDWKYNNDIFRKERSLTFDHSKLPACNWSGSYIDENASENKINRFNYCHCNANETNCDPDENNYCEFKENIKKKGKFKRMFSCDYIWKRFNDIFRMRSLFACADSRLPACDKYLYNASCSVFKENEVCSKEINKSEKRSKRVLTSKEKQTENYINDFNTNIAQVYTSVTKIPSFISTHTEIIDDRAKKEKKKEEKLKKKPTFTQNPCVSSNENLKDISRCVSTEIECKEAFVRRRKNKITTLKKKLKFKLKKEKIKKQNFGDKHYKDDLCHNFFLSSPDFSEISSNDLYFNNSDIQSRQRKENNEMWIDEDRNKQSYDLCDTANIFESEPSFRGKLKCNDKRKKLYLSEYDVTSSIAHSEDFKTPSKHSTRSLSETFKSKYPITFKVNPYKKIVKQVKKGLVNNIKKSNNYLRKMLTQEKHDITLFKKQMQEDWWLNSLMRTHCIMQCATETSNNPYITNKCIFFDEKEKKPNTIQNVSRCSHYFVNSAERLTQNSLEFSNKHVTNHTVRSPMFEEFVEGIHDPCYNFDKSKQLYKSQLDNETPLLYKNLESPRLSFQNKSLTDLDQITMQGSNTISELPPDFIISCPIYSPRSVSRKKQSNEIAEQSKEGSLKNLSRKIGYKNQNVFDDKIETLSCSEKPNFKATEKSKSNYCIRRCKKIECAPCDNVFKSEEFKIKKKLKNHGGKIYGTRVISKRRTIKKSKIRKQNSKTYQGNAKSNDFTSLCSRRRPSTSHTDVNLQPLYPLREAKNEVVHVINDTFHSKLCMTGHMESPRFQFRRKLLKRTANKLGMSDVEKTMKPAYRIVCDKLKTNRKSYCLTLSKYAHKSTHKAIKAADLLDKKLILSMMPEELKKCSEFVMPETEKHSNVSSIGEERFSKKKLEINLLNENNWYTEIYARELGFEKIDNDRCINNLVDAYDYLQKQAKKYQTRLSGEFDTNPGLPCSPWAVRYSWPKGLDPPKCLCPVHACTCAKDQVDSGKSYYAQSELADIDNDLPKISLEIFTHVRTTTWKRSNLFRYFARILKLSKEKVEIDAGHGRLLPRFDKAMSYELKKYCEAEEIKTQCLKRCHKAYENPSGSINFKYLKSRLEYENIGKQVAENRSGDSKIANVPCDQRRSSSSLKRTWKGASLTKDEAALKLDENFRNSKSTKLQPPVSTEYIELEQLCDARKTKKLLKENRSHIVTMKTISFDSLNAGLRDSRTTAALRGMCVCARRLIDYGTPRAATLWQKCVKCGREAATNQSSLDADLRNSRTTAAARSMRVAARRLIDNRMPCAATWWRQCVKCGREAVANKSSVISEPKKKKSKMKFRICKKKRKQDCKNLCFCSNMLEDRFGYEGGLLYEESTQNDVVHSLADDSNESDFNQFSQVFQQSQCENQQQEMSKDLCLNFDLNMPQCTELNGEDNYHDVRNRCQCVVHNYDQSPRFTDHEISIDSCNRRSFNDSTHQRRERCGKIQPNQHEVKFSSPRTRRNLSYSRYRISPRSINDNNFQSPRINNSPKMVEQILSGKYIRSQKNEHKRQSNSPCFKRRYRTFGDCNISSPSFSNDFRGTNDKDLYEENDVLTSEREEYKEKATYVKTEKSPKLSKNFSILKKMLIHSDEKVNLNESNLSDALKTNTANSNSEIFVEGDDLDKTRQLKRHSYNAVKKQHATVPKDEKFVIEHSNIEECESTDNVDAREMFDYDKGMNRRDLSNNFRHENPDANICTRCLDKRRKRRIDNILQMYENESDEGGRNVTTSRQCNVFGNTLCPANAKKEDNLGKLEIEKKHTDNCKQKRWHALEKDNTKVQVLFQRTKLPKHKIRTTKRDRARKRIEMTHNCSVGERRTEERIVKAGPKPDGELAVDLGFVVGEKSQKEYPRIFRRHDHLNVTDDEILLPIPASPSAFKPRDTSSPVVITRNSQRIEKIHNQTPILPPNLGYYKVQHENTPLSVRRIHENGYEM